MVMLSFMMTVSLVADVRLLNPSVKIIVTSLKSGNDNAHKTE